jgi:hypothetical protein
MPPKSPCFDSRAPDTDSRWPAVLGASKDNVDIAPWGTLPDSAGLTERLKFCGAAELLKTC